MERSQKTKKKWKGDAGSHGMIYDIYGGLVEEDKVFRERDGQIWPERRPEIDQKDDRERLEKDQVSEDSKEHT